MPPPPSTPLLLLLLLTIASPLRATPEPERLDAFVREVLASSGAPGAAVAVVRAGEPLLLRGWGTDGRGHDVTADTPFWIGSNTKSFTAVLVLQLVESGQVELDAPVQRYLPGFHLAGPGDAARITVRHLLTQTSGLPRAAGLRPVLAQSRATGPQLLAQLRDVHLAHPPGTTFEYCNWNYVLLGQLLETVTGRSWQEAVETRLLEPLGMTHSHSRFEDASADGMTANHRYLFGVPVEAEDVYLPGLAPTGYLVASARDLGRYLAMLQRGGVAGDGTRLLAPASVARLLAPATPPARSVLLGQTFEFRYAMGWFAGDFGAAVNARWHLGKLDSFSAWMAILPEQDLALAVMVNANSSLPGAEADLGRLGPGTVDALLGVPTPAALPLRCVHGAIAVILVTVCAGLLYRLRRALGDGNPVVGPALCGVLGVLLLAGWPRLVGLGWRGALRVLPDLSGALLLVGILALLVAVAPLLRRRRSMGSR